jgi:putative membrane protein
MLKYTRDFFNGLVFGITQIIPGVSGGTVAIILGFYDDLLEAVSRFTRDTRRHLRLLLPLLLGVAVGFLAFAELIDRLLGRYSLPVMFLFIGLVVGIVPHIYRTAKDGTPWTARGICAVLCAAMIPIAASHIRGDAPVSAPADIIAAIGAPYIALLFAAGVLASAALILPGVSGSFVLLVMGIYPVATHALSSVRIWAGDLSNTALALDILKVLLPLALGIIIGGLATARLINRLLRKHRQGMFRIIFGLLLGSVYALFREPIVYRGGTGVPVVAAGCAMLLLGCAASYGLGRKRM